MAIQDDKTILSKADLKEYHNRILPYLGGNMLMSTNNSDYYSTDEKVIGVWTDGKPVYQKTVACGTLPNNTTKTVSHNISNLDYIIGWSGSASESTGIHIKFPYVNIATLGKSCNVWIDKTAIGIETASDLRNYTKSYITIQYTKTTDTASTALTTPGAYDINFPNTWPANKEIFFGNGLYGKRYTGNLPAISSDGHDIVQLETGGTFSSTFKLISAGGSFTTYNASNKLCNMFLGFDGVVSSTSTTYSSHGSSGIYRTGAGEINFGIKLGDWHITTSNTYDVWVTYTK